MANPWNVTKSPERLSDLTLVQWVGVPSGAWQCPAHVARLCRRFLDDDGIVAIDWPSISFDLNPIEHLKDVIYSSSDCHQVQPQFVQELSDALIQVWGDSPGHCPSIHQVQSQTLSGVHTGDMLWVAIMKVGSACDFKFLLWCSVWFWIQPSVGWWFRCPLTAVTHFVLSKFYASVNNFNLNNTLIKIWCVIKVLPLFFWAVYITHWVL